MAGAGKEAGIKNAKHFGMCFEINQSTSTGVAGSGKTITTSRELSWIRKI
ncbi:hypothetical protein [Synechococcus sp. PROS-U-1]|nr:hypothetical protein [Synechococcus sp. PROS-U-1]QNJ02083.1 hypothetical protein SynPROSU1_00449 [Synechococcus sp. PROS-U-1]